MSSSSAPSRSEPAAPHVGPVHVGPVSSLIAAPEWQVIEFISDLHLSPGTPRTTAALEAYLRACRADAVIILGDFFEVWIGDDIADDAFAQRCIAALHEAARHRTVAMMVGNRDFLVGGSMLAQHGVIAIDDPTELDAFGQTIMLAHGDALCLADTDYQAFRRQVRAPAWQAQFLARPRAERAAMARSMRDASAARKDDPTTTWADADPAATITLLDQYGARTMVHGHTHKPHTHQPAVEGAPAETTRHVLSDWDLEAEVPRAEVLRLTAQGFERIALPMIGA